MMHHKLHHWYEVVHILFLKWAQSVLVTITSWLEGHHNITPANSFRPMQYMTAANNIG